MRIRNNGPASGAYRFYKGNNGALNKNLEKLSSGYTINRSADDAAGLAISEKMRAQITGLTGAQQNASHGIGLCQTAEGALQEVHGMLNRMLELSTQSANGTYDDAVDRQQLQKELVKLAQELNRIADTANFNGVYPLNGGYSTDEYVQTLGIVTEEEAEIQQRLNEVDAKSGEFQFSLAWDNRVDLDLHCVTPNSHICYWNREGDGGRLDVDAQAEVMMDKPVENIYFEEAQEGNYHVFVHNYSSSSAVDNAIVRLKLGDDIQTFTIGPIAPRQIIDIASFTYSKNSSPHIIWGSSGNSGNTGGSSSGTGSGSAPGGSSGSAPGGSSSGGLIDLSDGLGNEIPDKKSLIDLEESGMSGGSSSAGSSSGGPPGGSAELLSGDNHDEERQEYVHLLIGENGDEANFMDVPIIDMHANVIGLAGVDISTQQGAIDSLSKIRSAINYVSDARGTYGALQNRLEHTINNLGTMRENIQDAESTIRDTDMAAEMMKYTKNNILVQSAQSMLAQANMLPQGVLSLLQ